MAIEKNIAAFQSVCNDCEIIPVIKSNAYGHGIELIGSLLNQNQSIKRLGVASLDEALFLKDRQCSKEIIVLNYFQTSSIEDISRAIDNGGVTFTVFRPSDVKLLGKIARNRMVNCHVKVDVGTSRLGLRPKDIALFFRFLESYPAVTITGIFTHFADSENADQKFTLHQMNTFQKALKNVKKKSLLIHAACTAASLSQPLSRFHAIRLGIGLYGLWPSKPIEKFARRSYPSFALFPSLAWKTKILQIKEIPRGTWIGYGCAYQAKKKMKIATLPIGYFEGYDRRLSNIGSVLIRGTRCSVRGRICMNLTMVDVSHLSAVHPQEEVVLLGSQNDETISADEIANLTHTIHYEVVTRIHPLIPRIRK